MRNFENNEASGGGSSPIQPRVGKACGATKHKTSSAFLLSFLKIDRGRYCWLQNPPSPASLVCVPPADPHENMQRQVGLSHGKARAP